MRTILTRSSAYRRAEKINRILALVQQNESMVTMRRTALAEPQHGYDSVAGKADPPPANRSRGRPKSKAANTTQNTEQTPRRSERLKNRNVALSVKDFIAKAKQLQYIPDPKPEKSILSKEKIEKSSKEKQSSENQELQTKEKLPEKYELLSKFFDAMEFAVRLLKLRKSVPTFSNIQPQVETMTQKRFNYSHLAKILHLVPDVISVQKIMCRDEKSLCMKPDMKIQMTTPRRGASSSLGKEFRQTLMEFAESVLDSHDIPEAPLPEPFLTEKQQQESRLRRKAEEEGNAVADSNPTTKTPEVGYVDSAMSSLLPKGFQPRFVKSQGPEEKKELKRKAETEAKIEEAKRAKKNDKEDDDIFTEIVKGVVSDELVQTVREREMKAMDEGAKTEEMKEAEGRLLRILPKTLKIVRDVFRCSGRSVMTREELLQKMVANHPDVVDRAEMEEQFRLLEETVPHWIHIKNSMAGDVLFSVNPKVDFNFVQQDVAIAQ